MFVLLLKIGYALYREGLFVKIITFGSKNAFTLVEIMIVVAIIGLLSAIAIPNFNNGRESAIEKACLANMRQLGSALTVASSTTGASIGNLSENGVKAIVEPDYIRLMPHCTRGAYSTDSSGNVHCSAHSPTSGGGRPPVASPSL
jgi:prepilin-type N-terminal cleavage/methylation domain-containing protein